MQNAAFISIRDIINTYRLDRGKTVHKWWQYAPAACKAVQELSMTSLPIVQHIKLYKEPDTPYFRLPEGFVDWVSVGMQWGNRFIPVPVSNNLIPFLPQNCSPNPYSSEFGQTFQHGGDWKSWLNRECTYSTSDFFSGDFFENDYSQGNVSVSDEDCCGTSSFAYQGLFPFTTGTWFGMNQVGEFTKGMFTFMGRPDEVAFNIPKKMIVVPDCFPSNCLLLAYIGRVQADNMTYVPLTAQACIEAYMDWRIALAKRDNLSSSREYERLYNSQHRLLRARINDLTTTSIYRVINKGYVQNGWGVGNGFTGNSSNCNTTVVYQKKQAVVFFSAQEGSVVQSNLLVGTNSGEVAFLIINDVTKNTGYHLNATTGEIIFTDGTYITIGDKITVYYV